MCDRLLVTCAHVSVAGLGPGARFAVELPSMEFALFLEFAVAVTRRAVWSGRSFLFAVLLGSRQDVHRYRYRLRGGGA